MSLASAAARGALVTLVSQWIKLATTIAGIAILARLLSPEDFGLVAMVTAISGLALLLTDFGLSMASIQKQHVTHAERSNLFWINLVLGVALAAVLFASSWLVGAFYGTSEVVPIVQCVSVLMFLNALSAQSKAELSRRLEFRTLASIDVIAQFIGLAAAVGFALSGYGYWALVAQQIAIALVQTVSWLSAGRWRPSFPSRTKTMRPLIAFGANSLGTQLLNYVSNNADSVIVGKFLGADSLGIYSRAFQLFRMPMQQLGAPMTRVAFPVLSKLVGTPDYNRYVRYSQLLLTYLLGGVFFVAAAVADPLIDLFLGPGWDAAKPVFYVLAVGGVFQAMAYTYYWIFISKALTGLQLRFTVITKPLAVLCTFAGVPWGLLGVATGFAVGVFVNWLVLAVFAIPRTGVELGSRWTTARPLILYTSMLALAVPLNFLTAEWQNRFGALAVLLVGSVLYLLVAAISIRPIRRDMQQVLAAGKLLAGRRK